MTAHGLGSWMVQLGPECFDGGIRGCGLMFLWLSQSGGPQGIPEPALGLLLSGRRLINLTLALHELSHSRCSAARAPEDRSMGFCREDLGLHA